MVKIGVIGSQEQIASSLVYFQTTEGVSLSGVYSTEVLSDDSSMFHNSPAFEYLLSESDAIFILESARQPFEMALQSFRQGKHVFLEQISTLSTDEIELLLKSRKEANVKCLIGSNELCHPAFLALHSKQLNPLFIKSERRILFDAEDNRNIILDLMMKDIALVLHTVKSDIKRISANGLSVMGNQTDIASARLEFSNGCVAMLSVDKNSVLNFNQFTLYEPLNIVLIDFEDSLTTILTPSKSDPNQLESTSLSSDEKDPFKYQLENFRDCIALDANPLLKLREGYEKLHIAHKILKKIISFNEE